MKLQDSDIITAARELRDEQNDRLQVAPSPLKGRRTSTPLWWGAVAAALVVGFFVGKGSPDSPPALPVREGAITLEKSHPSPNQNHSAPSLTGRAGDESASSPAIIREVIHEVVHDTIYETRIVRVPTQQVMTAQAEPVPESPGCSMLCDDIPYDLLAGNN